MRKLEKCPDCSELIENIPTFGMAENKQPNKIKGRCNNPECLSNKGD